MMQYDWILTAIDAALSAGDAILQVYNDPNADFQIERKADHSPLTLADRKAHQTIVSFLQNTQMPILSEEGKQIPYEERAKWKGFWMVDPLDGTKEFIKHNGEFTVNIAWIEQGTPVFGVIYVPVTATLYWGNQEEGAYRITNITQRNGRSLHDLKQIAQQLPLPDELHRESFVIVASRSHLSPETEAYIAKKRTEHHTVELLSVGSSLKICRVSEGTADEYPRFAPTMEWDTAAGHAIARAVGIEVWQVNGKNPLVYNKPDLHNPWFLVKPLKKEEQ